MDRNKYFDKMRETNLLTNKAIWESLEPLKAENRGLYDFLVEIPAFKKRVLKEEKLRPFVLRLSYELAGGENWKNVVGACAAVEIFNISTYIDNTVFDGKHGVKQEDFANYIICSRTLQCVAFDLLKNFSDKSFEVVDLLNEICKTMYSVEYEDLNEFGELVENYGEYLGKYNRRCYGITGVFLENIMKIGVVLAGGSEKDIGLIGKIGKNLGVVLQIVNDIGDFVPPTGGVYDCEKVYKDQFSDLKNSKITLPIYYALKFGSRKNRKILRNAFGSKCLSGESCNNISRILVEEGGLAIAGDLAEKYSAGARSLFGEFERSETRDLLKMVFQISKTSKYLKGLTKSFGGFVRGKNDLVLVDEDDKAIGVGEKIDVHVRGQLHRAFSVCVFNSKKEMLIQKRALDKYHCGGLWANACCSHPRPDESVINGASRRLMEEMGFSCKLKKVGKFHYKKKFDNGLTENEIDHVFVGKYDGKVLPNNEEVCEYRWVGIVELWCDVLKNPDNYCVWLKDILKILVKGGIK